MRVSAVVVRPYRSDDRDTVRRICHRTGFMGEPADWFWADEASFADMFSGYYTDAEPESVLVAEADGVVCGYLLGCRDSTRAWDPLRVAVRHVVRRGIAFRPGTAGTVWRAVGDALGDLAARRVRLADLDFVDPRYPAHLHINLLPAARGRGAGAALVRTWLDQLRHDGVPGCFLQTMAENDAAIAFFETMGFTAVGRDVLASGERTRDGRRTHVRTMVQALEPTTA